MTATDIEQRLAALSQRRGVASPGSRPGGPDRAPRRVREVPAASVTSAATDAGVGAPGAAPRRSGVTPGAGARERRWPRRVAVVLANLLVAAAALPVLSALRSDPVPQADPRGMVRVPGGTYVVGAGERGTGRRASARAVTVGDFWIMRSEMTVAQLAGLTGESNDPAVADAIRIAGNQPARGVDYATAERACAALGGRLPSEAEWEVAGRGPAGARTLGTGTPGGGGGLSGFGIAGLQSGPVEIVDRPYAPTPAGTVLLRGGPDLVTRRAVRDVVAARAGVRCAADRVADHLADDFAEPGRPPLLAALPAAASVRGGALRIAPRGPVLLPAGVATADGRIAATFTSVGTGARYGLVARVAAAGSYALVVEPRTRTWRLERRVGPRRSVLAQGSAGLLQAPAGPDRLALTTSGAWIEASVDGVLVARVADRRFADGDLGILVEPVAGRAPVVSVDDLAIDLAMLDPNTRSL